MQAAALVDLRRSQYRLRKRVGSQRKFKFSRIVTLAYKQHAKHRQVLIMFCCRHFYCVRIEPHCRHRSTKGSIANVDLWIVDRGSWIMDRGSWIVDHGSWIVDHGSRVWIRGKSCHFMHENFCANFIMTLASVLRDSKFAQTASVHVRTLCKSYLGETIRHLFMKDQKDFQKTKAT